MSQQQLQAKALKDIRAACSDGATPENRRCADCPNRPPTYVNCTHWTLICTVCAGIHREFGHRVKSISMSMFTPAEADAVLKNGNALARLKYLAKWRGATDHPEPEANQQEKLKSWIKAKYVQRAWVDDSVPSGAPEPLTNIVKDPLPPIHVVKSQPHNDQYDALSFRQLLDVAAKKGLKAAEACETKEALITILRSHDRGHSYSQDALVARHAEELRAGHKSGAQSNQIFSSDAWGSFDTAPASGAPQQTPAQDFFSQPAPQQHTAPSQGGFVGFGDFSHQPAAAAPSPVSQQGGFASFGDFGQHAAAPAAAQPGFGDFSQQPTAAVPAPAAQGGFAGFGDFTQEPVAAAPEPVQAKSATKYDDLAGMFVQGNDSHGGFSSAPAGYGAVSQPTAAAPQPGGFGGFGSAPQQPSGGFSTQQGSLSAHQQGAFGQPQGGFQGGFGQQGAFGAQGGFGSQQPLGFGSQQPQGFGAQQGAFGSQQGAFGGQQGGFGGQQAGFGGQQQGGFGSQQGAFGSQQGAFGSQQGGFGGQQAGFGGQQQGGFGSQQGGFNSQQVGFGGQPAGFSAQPAGFPGQQGGFGGQQGGFSGQPVGFGGQVGGQPAGFGQGLGVGASSHAADVLRSVDSAPDPFSSFGSISGMKQAMPASASPVRPAATNQPASAKTDGALFDLLG